MTLTLAEADAADRILDEVSYGAVGAESSFGEGLVRTWYTTTTSDFDADAYMGGEPFAGGSLEKKGYSKGLGAASEDAQVRGLKLYELRDHLGNVTVVVSDRALPVDDAGVVGLSAAYFRGQVKSARDFYPYGMVMVGRRFDTPAYRYGFNGKEFDSEMNGEGNMYDYGFRVHDPRLGRFLSFDPLAPDYPWYTPYQYAGNKPIRFIDLDGAEEAEPKAFLEVAEFLAHLKIPSSTHFPNISGELVKEQLMARLKNPRIIEQGASWYCGPAMAAYSCAIHDPKAYTKAVLDIYLNGGKAENYDGLPEEFRTLTPKDGGIDGMPVVDYLLISTMRYTENDHFGYFLGPTPTEKVSQGTWPGEIEEFVEDFDANYQVSTKSPLAGWVAIWHGSGKKVGILFNKNEGKSAKDLEDDLSQKKTVKKGIHYVMIDSIKLYQKDGETRVGFSWWDYGDAHPELNTRDWNLGEWNDKVHKGYFFEQK